MYYKIQKERLYKNDQYIQLVTHNSSQCHYMLHKDKLK